MLVLLGPSPRARALAPSAADAPLVLPSTPGLTLTGQNGSGFGQAVATAGDINADGYDDALVLSWLNGLDSGWRVNVFHGAVGGLSGTPALTLTGEAMTETGRIAPAGDVNNDGYADVLIGSYSSYSPNQGRVYVHHGGASGLGASPAATLIGLADTRYAISIASAGDVNGDGFSDAIVGADQCDSSRGCVFVYLGGSGGINPTPAISLTGYGGLFGNAAVGAGDVNNDGFDDVAIGAPIFENIQGRAYIYLGSLSGLSATPTITLSPTEMIYDFGTALAPAGDVDKDGFDDLLVGAANYGQGRVFLYRGTVRGLDSTPAQRFTGEAASSWFGFTMAPLGDVNNDGYADVILGDGEYDSSKGRAYILTGGVSGTGGPQLTPALTLTGVTTGDLFGAAVSSAGDIQNDSRPDFIVGARGVNGYQGQAYVYYVGLGEADMSLTKAASSQLVRPGELVTFTLTFVNNGPDIAAGVVVSDVLPGVSTNPSFISSGVTVTQTTGGPYVWQVQDLAVGQGGTITVSATFAPEVSGMPRFVNTATMSAVNDSAVANNTATVTMNPFAVNVPLVMKNMQP